jgi:membrane-associated protein
MSYPRFAVANIAGAVLWVGLCLTAGYLFGQVPFVKKNFSLVVLGIVVVTTIPVIIGMLKSWKKRA